MKTNDILVFLQLKGLGRATAFKLVEYYHFKEYKFSRSDASELFEFYNECKYLKIARAMKEYVLEDFEFAFKQTSSLLERSFACEIGVVSYFDSSYPKRLKSLTKAGKNDSPLILYYKGDINKLNQMPTIAIIGTRDILPDGAISGEVISKTFANQGFNVVSGLALGCDTVAHKGALLANKGITTAVLAQGLDSVYPKENSSLAKEILDKGGVLLSEYPIGTTVRGPQLVERDRIQAGLSDATLVIHTGEKGGTMHAVHTTLENKKPLYVIEYKSSQMNNHEKVQGNRVLVQQDKAKALNSENMHSVIDYLKKLANQKGYTNG
ncbi:DNA-processing protein DprA [Myroides odoratimimus]|uniref:DNA-processing protein DprA n=1 Tax=Myroides odoratimimus TaxID=76832 RepID=UPI002578BBC5|nr:DNA-processing protein DprA [Myroides odoratimimus]MDM1465382.1 DNA-protecting protein DprA [Myroides odoratimimus]MDM1475386.1 DNA-protecting protein DprA [Myroides odoratimimus]